MSSHTGKTALIVGVANKRSIAWAIARALHAEGAGLVLTYQNERLRENVEELAATLDPANRTLLKVTMEDAAAADELFRVLMGDKVEPRREFIEKHSLDVKNLDV